MAYMNDILTIEKKENELVPVLTETQYKAHIEQYNSFLLSSNQIPGPDSIKQYFDFCKSIFKPSTVAVKKSSIRAGLEKKYEKHPNKDEALALIESVFKNIKTPPIDVKVKSDRIVDDREIEKLSQGGVWYNHRTKKEILIRPSTDLLYLIKWLTKTGMRIFEVITLKKSSFYPSRKNDNILYFEFIGKRGKPRTNFVTKELYNEVDSIFNGKIYLFDYWNKDKEFDRMKREWEPCRKELSHRLNSYSLKVIGKEVNPHDFRHYFATSKLKEGKSLKAIANWLGHTSTSTTSDMYVHDELEPDDIY